LFLLVVAIVLLHLLELLQHGVEPVETLVPGLFEVEIVVVAARAMRPKYIHIGMVNPDGVPA
jgi:hypothetical protein